MSYTLPFAGKFCLAFLVEEESWITVSPTIPFHYLLPVAKTISRRKTTYPTITTTITWKVKKWKVQNVDHIVGDCKLQVIKHTINHKSVNSENIKKVCCNVEKRQLLNFSQKWTFSKYFNQNLMTWRYDSTSFCWNYVLYFKTGTPNKLSLVWLIKQEWIFVHLCLWLHRGCCFYLDSQMRPQTTWKTRFFWDLYSQNLSHKFRIAVWLRKAVSWNKSY